MNTTSSLNYAPNASSAHRSNLLEVHRLKQDEMSEASRVLSEAFEGYPVANYMFEGFLEQGPERFRVMFEYLINSRIVRNWPVFGCRLGGELVGVAVVSEPGEEWSTPELDAQWERATKAMGKRAMDRFLEYADACDAGLPDWPHHYLGILGVKPEYQGIGCGSSLVEAVKSDALLHDQSRGVCLNTETTINLPFYRRHGFKTIDSRDVGSIHTWCMTLKW